MRPRCTRSTVWSAGLPERGLAREVDRVPAPAMADAPEFHFEAGAARVTLEGGAGLLGPDREHSPRRETLASTGQRARTEVRVLAALLRPFEEIEQDRVPARPGVIAQKARDVSDHDVHARVGERVSMSRSRGPAAPLDDAGLQLDHADARADGQRVERCPQRRSEPQSADQQPGRLDRREFRDGQRRESLLGALRAARHQHPPVDEQQQIPLAARAQFVDAVGSLRLRESAPGQRQD